jgi:starch synthase
VDPLDAIADLENPDYERKATIKHSDADYCFSLSPSLTKFIESSGKPFTFRPKMNSRSVYQLKTRFYQFKTIIEYAKFFKVHVFFIL